MWLTCLDISGCSFSTFFLLYAIYTLFCNLLFWSSHCPQVSHAFPTMVICALKINTLMLGHKFFPLHIIIVAVSILLSLTGLHFMVSMSITILFNDIIPPWMISTSMLYCYNMTEWQCLLIIAMYCLLIFLVQNQLTESYRASMNHTDPIFVWNGP